MNFFIGLFYILLVSVSSQVLTDTESSEVRKLLRADSHAPISIMGDHTHKESQVMFSYRFMTMKMDGYQSGSSSSNYTKARTHSLGGHYMTIPQEMTINMHMIDAMYGTSDDLTFMVMGSCIDNEMKIINLYQYIYSNYYGDGVRVYNLQ